MLVEVAKLFNNNFFYSRKSVIFKKVKSVMKIHKNYILGGGPAGLAAAYFLKEYKVIDKNPLGQLNTPCVPGPRLLQYTPEMMEFITKFIKGMVMMGIISPNLDQFLKVYMGIL